MGIKWLLYFMNRVEVCVLRVSLPLPLLPASLPLRFATLRRASSRTWPITEPILGYYLKLDLFCLAFFATESWSGRSSFISARQASLLCVSVQYMDAMNLLVLSCLFFIFTTVSLQSLHLQTSFPPSVSHFNGSLSCSRGGRLVRDYCYLHLLLFPFCIFLCSSSRFSLSPLPAWLRQFPCDVSIQ